MICQQLGVGPYPIQGHRAFLGPRIYTFTDAFSSSFSLSSSIFFLSATLRAHWRELNQTRPLARKWVRFENVCPKSGVYCHPKYRGPKPIFFDDLQLNDKFNGLYLRNKTWYTSVHNRLSAFEITRGLLHRLIISWTLVHKWLKIWPAFFIYPL